MYTYEERLRAVKAHIASGFRLNRTIVQLGYPSHQALTHGRGLDIGQDSGLHPVLMQILLLQIKIV